MSTDNTLEKLLFRRVCDTISENILREYISLKILARIAKQIDKQKPSFFSITEAIVNTAVMFHTHDQFQNLRLDSV